MKEINIYLSKPSVEMDVYLQRTSEIDIILCDPFFEMDIRVSGLTNNINLSASNELLLSEPPILPRLLKNVHPENNSIVINIEKGADTESVKQLRNLGNGIILNSGNVYAISEIYALVDEDIIELSSEDVNATITRYRVLFEMDQAEDDTDLYLDEFDEQQIDEIDYITL